jgi:hypothetical protein
MRSEHFHDSWASKPMAIDIREIELTVEQKRRIAELAEQTGQPWNKVVDQQLAASEETANTKPYWSFKDRYIDDYGCLDENRTIQILTTAAKVSTTNVACLSSSTRTFC